MTMKRREFVLISGSTAATATAVMILVEEGTLSLDAPAERWLPELANRRVLRRVARGLRRGRVRIKRNRCNHPHPKLP